MRLILLQNPYQLQPYLVVWYNDKNAEIKHYCHCLYTKDYESSVYHVLQTIEDRGWECDMTMNVILYKSAVKASKINNSTYRAYVPIAYYNGNLYNLKREKHMFAPPICIYRDGTSAWTARYERKNYYDLLSDSIVPQVKDLIDANANRVYGKEKTTNRTIRNDEGSACNIINCKQ